MITQVRYAFFDFDGTLISKDSFLTLLRKGLKAEPWRIIFILLLAPMLFLTAIFKIKAASKSILLWSLTVGKGKRNTIRYLQQVLLPEVDKIWFQEASTVLNTLKHEGYEIVLVSASGQTWIRAMLRPKFQKFRLIIGSRLSFCLGGVVINGKNCYRSEKINRITQMLGKNFIWQSTWSDHIADIPMFLHAAERNIISPIPTHVEEFNKVLGNNMRILYWKTQ